MVKLNSWQEIKLTPAEQQLRDKNLWVKSQTIPNTINTTTPVTLKSWEVVNLNANELDLRNKNLKSTSNVVNNTTPIPSTTKPIEQTIPTPTPTQQVQPKAIENNSITPTKETPKTTTDITYSEDKTAFDPNKVISKAEQFTWADWKTYQTVRNSDNTLTTIDVSTWNAVTSKYTDVERDTIKQWFLQQWTQNIKSWDIYNQLLQNPNIDLSWYNQNEVKIAKDRIKAFKTFANLDEWQLQSAINIWQLQEWTQLYNDLISNPEIKLKLDNAKKLNSINWKTTDWKTKEENITEDLLTKHLTVKQALEDWEISQDELSQLTMNDNIKALSAEKKARYEKYLELNNKYNQIAEETRKELQWSWATTTAVEALIASRQEAIRPSLDLAESMYNSTLWAYKDELDNSMNLFATNLKLYQDQQSREQQLSDETRKLEQNYQYTYWDINSTNPTLQNIAIERAVADLYTKYPLPWMESQATKVAKIQNLMSQWMTWTQAIAQLESEIRNSDRYKQYIAPKTEKAQGLIKMWEDKIYDPNSWKWIIAPWTSTSWLTNLSNIAWKNIQCGKAVNTYIQDVTWSYGQLWDTLDSKLKALESIWVSDWPVQWWIFVSNPLNNTVWHTWIVQSVNADWSITVLEANAEWKNSWWPLVERTYSADQVANMQFSQAPTTSVAQDLDTKIIQIWKIAYWKTISDKEWERITKIVNKYPNATNYEIALAVKWFDIKDKNDTNTAISYLNIFNRLPDNIKPDWFEQALSNYINKKDWKWANEYTAKFLERSIKNDVPSDEYISPSWYKTWLKSINNLISLINNNKDNIWLISWNVNDIINKFKNTWDYQKIKTLLQMNQADVRRTFAWSAVTATEMKALEDFIGWTTKMNADNLLTILQTVQDKTTSEFLNQRAWYWFDYNKYLWLWQSSWTTKWNTKTDIKSRIEQIRNSKNNW